MTEVMSAPFNFIPVVLVAGIGSPGGFHEGSSNTGITVFVIIHLSRSNAGSICSRVFFLPCRIIRIICDICVSELELLIGHHHKVAPEVFLNVKGFSGAGVGKLAIPLAFCDVIAGKEGGACP